MENPLCLYHKLVQVLRKHWNWLDIRHLKTLAWMMTGLIQSGAISLTAWVPYVHSRAVYAQSAVRRFRRWLSNPRIEMHSLYGPLIQQALAEWGRRKLYLALDTSMFWGKFCLVRIAVVYRGRVVPLVWRVLKHSSSSVSFEVSQDLLHKAAALVLLGCRVVFTADRDFADVHLTSELRRLKWHYRIRIMGNFLVCRRGHPHRKVDKIPLTCGQA